MAKDEAQELLRLKRNYERARDDRVRLEGQLQAAREALLEYGATAEEALKRVDELHQKAVGLRERLGGLLRDIAEELDRREEGEE